MTAHSQFRPARRRVERRCRSRVGQALVGIDPVREEPRQIAVHAGVLEQLLERPEPESVPATSFGAGCTAAGASRVLRQQRDRRRAKRGRARDRRRGRAASRRHRRPWCGSRWARWPAASGWPALSPGLSGSASASAGRGFKRFERLLAAALFFHPQRAHEVGHAFVEPRGRRVRRVRDPRVRERVGQNAVELIRSAAEPGRTSASPAARRFQRARPAGSGKIEKRELGAGRLAKPALQERRDRGCGAGPVVDGRVVFGQRPERSVRGADAAAADGDEEAGRFKAEGCASRLAVATPGIYSQSCLHGLAWHR